MQTFRTAALDLIESLEAVTRIARWPGAEAAPETLRESAAKIVARLGVADRLVASRYDGPPADATCVAEMCDAMRKLDVAYRAYRRRAESSVEERHAAAATLEGAVAAANAGAWQ